MISCLDGLDGDARLGGALLFQNRSIVALNAAVYALPSVTPSHLSSASAAMRLSWNPSQS